MALKATPDLRSQKVHIAFAHSSADIGSFQISFIHILARMQQAAQVSSILTMKYHHLFQKGRMRYVPRFGWTLLQDNIWFLDSDSKENVFTSCFQPLGVFTPTSFSYVTPQNFYIPQTPLFLPKDECELWNCCYNGKTLWLFSYM